MLQVRTTKAQIEDYFSHFLKLKPHGKIDQSNVRMLANDVGIHSGESSCSPCCPAADC